MLVTILRYVVMDLFCPICLYLPREHMQCRSYCSLIKLSTRYPKNLEIMFSTLRQGFGDGDRLVSVEIVPPFAKDRTSMRTACERCRIQKVGRARPFIVV